MNWQAKVGLAFLIPVLLFSCKKSDNVILNDDGIDITYSDTFTAEVTTILVDSINSSDWSNMLIGRCNSSNLGETRASAYVGLKLSTENFSLGKNTTFQKAVLYMNPSAAYGYGEFSGISVYRLNGSLGTTSYYTTDSAAYSDHIYTSGLGELSLNKENKYELPASFGTEMFAMVDSNTQVAFHDTLPGLAIIPSSSATAIYSYDLTALSDSSRNYIRLFYSKLDESDTSKTVYKDTFYDVYMDNSINYFTGLTENIENTEFAKIKDTSLLEGIGVFKGSLRERIHIKYPGMSDFLNDKERLIMNNAELEFTLNGGGSVNMPPDYFFIKSLFDDGTESDQLFVATYISSENKYIINNPLLAEEIVNQAGLGQDLSLLFTTMDNHVVTECMIDPSSLKLKIYYSKVSD